MMTNRSMTVTEEPRANKACFGRGPRFRTRVIVCGLVALVFASVLTGYYIGSADTSHRHFEPPDPVNPLPVSSSVLRVFRKGAVCTDNPYCSKVGREILLQNGTAIDAAIAAMFCNGLLNQQSMGIGGGFFMTIYIKEEQKAYTVVGRETAAAAAHKDMFGENQESANIGPLASGIPGEVRGTWMAHRRWGRLPWATLLEPTIKVCKNGFLVSRPMYDGIMQAQYVKNDPHLRRTYVDPLTGEFYKVGSMVKPSQELCRTLKTIAEKGGDEMYNGTLAQQFQEDLERAGSIITAEDLRNYTPKIVEPLRVSLKDGDVLFTPPPPSSGLLLVDILSILSGYNFTSRSINSTEDKILTYHRIIEAFKYAYATRTKLGDSDFLDLQELVDEVTSPSHGEDIRQLINDTLTSNSTRTYGADDYYTPSDSGTAHISIIASNGDAVSVTSSINFYFGAGYTTEKTGIIMNNVMDDFASPGFSNYYGVTPSSANFIEPGKRPLSSISPSIIIDKNGNAKLVIGASGGTHITTSMALVTIRQLWFNQNIKEAVDEPRFHHQLLPMELHYEYGTVEDIANGLRAKGHALIRYRRASVVCALFRNKTAIYANADYRKGGDVAGMD